MPQYGQGVSKALRWLGLQDSPEESHLGRNIAMGAAATTPFLGLIGQQRLRHNPLLNPDIRRGSLEELARRARAGDVVVTGKGGSPVTSLTGNELWHAEPVLGRRGGKGIGVSGGELTPRQLRLAGELHPERAAHYEELAKAIEKDPRQLEKHIEPLDKRLRGVQQDRLVLLRPKKELSPAQIEKLRRVGYSEAIKPYQIRRAFSTQLKDWFLPKIPGLERLGRTQCSGNICMTPAAHGFESVHGGTPVVPGKAAKDVISSDFLRSKHYEPVMAHIDEAAAKNYGKLHRLGSLGTRAALGLGLAGSIYGLTEDPATAAIPVGAAGAPALARKAFGFKTFRPLRQLLKHDSKRSLRLKNISRRTLPLMLAGGLGSYLAARLGTDALTD